MSLVQPMEQINLRGIKKSYGKEMAVQKLDLTVNSGDFLTILGPSGCGKTTMLRAIAGLEEPDEGEILDVLLPRNLSVQIFRSILENNASEHGARMSAMDNATRNAGEMIDTLTLNYNRTRQAFITKELIEIISGAEAV